MSWKVSRKRGRKAFYRSIEELAFEHVNSGVRWTPALKQMQRYYGKGNAHKAVVSARQLLKMVGLDG